jgi:hypothetical protein
MKDYLKAVTKYTNLDNYVICWLYFKSKPVHVCFEAFINQHTQILIYVKKGYICHCLENANNAELCKQAKLIEKICQEAPCHQDWHAKTPGVLQGLP